jgi:hypothetical protein
MRIPKLSIVNSLLKIECPISLFLSSDKELLSVTIVFRVDANLAGCLIFFPVVDPRKEREQYRIKDHMHQMT